MGVDARLNTAKEVRLCSCPRGSEKATLDIALCKRVKNEDSVLKKRTGGPWGEVRPVSNRFQKGFVRRAHPKAFSSVRKRYGRIFNKEVESQFYGPYRNRGLMNYPCCHISLPWRRTAKYVL